MRSSGHVISFVVRSLSASQEARPATPPPKKKTDDQQYNWNEDDEDEDGYDGAPRERER